jgi:hypothetical protein
MQFHNYGGVMMSMIRRWIGFHGESCIFQKREDALIFEILTVLTSNVGKTCLAFIM